MNSPTRKPFSLYPQGRNFYAVKLNGRFVGLRVGNNGGKWTMIQAKGAGRMDVTDIIKDQAAMVAAVRSMIA